MNPCLPKRQFVRVSRTACSNGSRAKIGRHAPFTNGAASAFGQYSRIGQIERPAVALHPRVARSDDVLQPIPVGTGPTIAAAA
jgi:hypothetical protein